MEKDPGEEQQCNQEREQPTHRAIVDERFSHNDHKEEEGDVPSDAFNALPFQQLKVEEIGQSRQEDREEERGEKHRRGQEYETGGKGGRKGEEQGKKREKEDELRVAHADAFLLQITGARVCIDRITEAASDGNEEERMQEGSDVPDQDDAE